MGDAGSAGSKGGVGGVSDDEGKLADGAALKPDSLAAAAAAPVATEN